MDCACAVPIDCGEETTWGARHVQHAGKDHVCCECGSKILKGSEYFFHTCFGDGIRNYKVCLDCQTVIWKFFDNGWIFTQVWDDLAYYLDDHWADDLPSNCISQLSSVARAKVCDILQRYQEGS